MNCLSLTALAKFKTVTAPLQYHQTRTNHCNWASRRSGRPPAIACTRTHRVYLGYWFKVGRDMVFDDHDWEDCFLSSSPLKLPALETSSLRMQQLQNIEVLTEIRKSDSQGATLTLRLSQNMQLHPRMRSFGFRDTFATGLAPSTNYTPRRQEGNRQII